MIDENDVILYIKNNPKFLEKNMDKFLDHDFYVEKSDTINLTKYHLKMLRKKNNHCESILNSIININDHNNKLSKKYLMLYSDLYLCTNKNEIFERLTKFSQNVNLEFRYIKKHPIENNFLNELKFNNNIFLGHVDAKNLFELIDEKNQSDKYSLAIIRLDKHGYLLFKSSDVEHFNLSLDPSYLENLKIQVEFLLTNFKNT